MNRILFFAIVFCLVAFAACSKDQFQTKPQISVKSLNGNVVPLQGVLKVTFDFTDKEGDLGKGIFFYQPKLLNKRRPIANSDAPYVVDSSNLIPEFPDKNKGELELRLTYENLYREVQQNGLTDLNDTIVVRAWIKDRAGNKSDTVTTGSIIILGQ
jgi:hypothetical protein